MLKKISIGLVMVLLVITLFISVQSCVTKTKENSNKVKEDPHKVLSNAIELSQNGNAKEAIKMLQPLLKRKNIDKEILFQAHLTLALQYYRYRDFDSFKDHVLEADKHKDSSNSDYFNRQLKKYRSMVEKGSFR